MQRRYIGHLMVCKDAADPQVPHGDEQKRRHFSKEQCRSRKVEGGRKEGSKLGRQGNDSGGEAGIPPGGSMKSRSGLVRAPSTITENRTTTSVATMSVAWCESCD